ncbi:class I SAM-dependent methyltransferase [Actinomadura miaoliensis]|uniref:Class I SAM-dependent methyltransferase n=1 Tax=Actinomadura miaoliensis TaxID=430685 RepID=A0ABP7W787_9ACTN
MHLSELLEGELSALRARSGRDALAFLETGSIRGSTENYQSNDGWSTLTFARHVRDHGGSLVSIDLDVHTADAVLRAHDLRRHVNLIEGHSIEVLAAILAGRRTSGAVPLDVVLLDSDNSADLILHEYLIVQHMIRPGGMMMVDDVEPGSTGVVKGHQLVPWLEARAIPYRIERRTGDGYATGVLIMETPWRS